MDISTSIRKLTNLFIALFLALSIGLVYWQVVAAPTLYANPHNIRTCLASNNAVRGRILDRNGVVLAYSVPDNNVCGGYIRKYTDPSLAGLIGYYAPGYYQIPGTIETDYNDVLTGNSGRTVLDNTVDKVLHQSPHGNDIYLTIDDRIQKAAAADFANYHPESDPLNLAQVPDEQAYPTNRGSAVVTDPHTGEILAMVSAPGYDPNKLVQTLTAGDQSYYDQLNSDPDLPLNFRPTQEVYTPGSTFKTVTLLAALDKGTTSLSTMWNKSTDYDPIPYPDGTVLGDNLGYGQYIHTFNVDTEFGYANSDNIMFAHVGEGVGQDSWISYAEKMGLDQSMTLGNLSVRTSSILRPDGRPLTSYDFATDAFGQGVDDVTSLQMSMIDNTVANNGVLMQPMIVSKIVENNGTPIETDSPEQMATVASPQAAYQVRQAMYAVMSCGSAWRVNQAQASPFANSVAGKTGTGQISDTAHPQAWMLTQAPFYLNSVNQMPDLTIVAMRENGGEGAYADGPAVLQMYQDIFGNGYVKTKNPMPAPVNPYTYCAAHNLGFGNPA